MLSIKNLTVFFPNNTAVSDVSFEIAPGEVFGLVGESGSGKSMTAMAIARLLPPDACVTFDSRIQLDDVELLSITEAKMRHFRKERIAYIFQDPNSFNPVMTIGAQLAETKAPMSRILETLKDVNLSDGVLAKYPHQLSGGMKQRLMIALALIRDVHVILADEMTTALDVTTARQILTLLRQLAHDRKLMVLFITHDMGVLANIADRIGVMYGSTMVELANMKDFKVEPKHPYSRCLIAAMPSSYKKSFELTGRVPVFKKPVEGCAFLSRCPHRADGCEKKFERTTDVRCHRKEKFQVPSEPLPEVIVKDQSPVITLKSFSVQYGSEQVVHNIDLEVMRGHTLALVGESGSGKTSVARAMLGLTNFTGDYFIEGKRVSFNKSFRSKVQMIFQDPSSSLSPRMRIEEILLEGSRALGLPANPIELMEQVNLAPELLSSYPHQLSGGQKQRVAIARSLATQARVLVLDEATASLDVSVSASIINLLARLQAEQMISYVFITHDLSLVEHLADNVAVMYKGQIVEAGTKEQIIGSPEHEYTKKLLAARMSFST